MYLRGYRQELPSGTKRREFRPNATLFAYLAPRAGQCFVDGNITRWWEEKRATIMHD